MFGLQFGAMIIVYVKKDIVCGGNSCKHLLLDDWQAVWCNEQLHSPWKGVQSSPWFTELDWKGRVFAKSQAVVEVVKFLFIWRVHNSLHHKFIRCFVHLFQPFLCPLFSLGWNCTMFWKLLSAVLFYCFLIPTGSEMVCISVCSYFQGFPVLFFYFKGSIPDLDFDL